MSSLDLSAKRVSLQRLQRDRLLAGQRVAGRDDATDGFCIARRHGDLLPRLGVEGNPDIGLVLHDGFDDPVGRREHQIEADAGKFRMEG
jgi:hypothetical protein